jgi:hypothetical protein
MRLTQNRPAHIGIAEHLESVVIQRIELWFALDTEHLRAVVTRLPKYRNLLRIQINLDGMLVLTANLQEKAAWNNVGSRKLVRFVTQAADLWFIEMAQCCLRLISVS